MWLNSIITPPLASDHILNKFGCFSDSEREEIPSSSSINMSPAVKVSPL
jgi:hypothetical protein